MTVPNMGSLGGGHCCVCTNVCGHIGGPSYCAQHKPESRRADLPVYEEIERARQDSAFRERLRERMEANRRLLERIEEGPVDWRSAWSAESAKFQAETVTTSFLATLLRECGHKCHDCRERLGTHVLVGDGLSRRWLCDDCPTTAKGSS